mmetsp:Transcript_88804/g.253835  ORF Transcript_88804/g.253835 Transcript_88804/m.253835 type:complete len:195 (+) Transcript_88804:132-716(+)|eukprot:CAMPEP_0119481900 /NCGR_PEP_ID=MMETSP1344-20130328/10011_1 /TAXON_ID=236787 /ORGANISM="Florenciella parvula, Strain CCMP2471" /LENGTH=194 /DNA_ID=CAMNT_0007516281 /DNA_START=144 /DNA_END=728 /DNA_ORIENTATION=+
MAAVLHAQPSQIDPTGGGAEPHAAPPLATTGRGYWGGVLGRIVGARSGPDGAGFRTAPTMAGAATSRCYRAGAVEAPAITYLDGPRVLSCTFCRMHITTHDQIISKSFHGRGGRAYLLNRIENYTCGPIAERMLITGMHTVADVHCAGCKQVLGWKYDDAMEPSQKYKIGKFIVEKGNLNEEEEEDYTREDDEW